MGMITLTMDELAEACRVVAACDLKDAELEAYLEEFVEDCILSRWPDEPEGEYRDDPKTGYYGPRVPAPVIVGIVNLCGSLQKAQAVLHSMRWSSDGCWLFSYHGMTVGAELDGYVHS